MKRKDYINNILLAALSLLFITNSFATSLKSAPLPCPIITVSGTNVDCYGQSNGKASVAISLGSGNFSINWSNGMNTKTITGLPAGTYTVTVSDLVTGCTVTGAYVVESPDPISISASIIDVKCYGDATGKIYTIVNGGNGGNSYSWKNSSSVEISTSKDLMNTISDTYTYSVTDNKGCVETRNYTISQPAEAIDYSAIIENAKCNSSLTGKINFTVWGGTPSYTYSWSNGAKSQDLTNLSAGNYTVTVTDKNNCQINKTYTITEPDQLTGALTANDVNCYGESNGSLNISMIGGTTPYTYEWENSVSVYSMDSPNLLNVPADMYEVTVTDKNGCKYTASKQVNEPSELTLSHTFKNINCHGGSDGYIHLTVSGGTPSYNYVWTDNIGNTVSTMEDLNNVPADIYTVVVTDDHGCQKQITQELTQPKSPIAVNVTKLDVLCYGMNTGEINLDVTGGTKPYTYNWSTSQTTSKITGLIAMKYNYVVTDYNACTYSGSVIIDQPAQPIQVVESITNVNCFGEYNGSVDLTVTGGTTPYDYKWVNSSHNMSTKKEDLTNYPADLYVYTITDDHNCIYIDTAIITEPSLLESTISGVDILCKGGNNGSVDLTVTGGVLNYSYQWNNGAITEDLSNLTAGTYSVIVEDAHGCSINNSITLIEPKDSLSYAFQVTDVRCNDGEDGKINLEVEGGTYPYYYDWSNGGIQSSVDSLTTGYYTFIVTDDHNCIITDSIFVDQPDPLLLNEVVTPVTCKGLSDGEIDLFPTGGTAPYEFKWFNSNYVLSAQTEDIIGYPTDTFQVEVVDTNNCFNEFYIFIPEPEKLEISYTVDAATCYGTSSGNIYVTIEGGNPGYDKLWSTGDTTQNLLGIPAGEYKLNVTDQKECEDSILVEIEQPEPIELSFETTEVTCVDQHDGTAIVTAVGGNGGYFYDWSNGASTAYTDSLGNEYYYVTVVDILGCTEDDSVYITKNMQGCIDPVNAFTPNGDNYNDTWLIDNMYLYPTAEVSIYNKWGTRVHYSNGLYSPWDGRVRDRPIPSAVYYYVIDLHKDNRKNLKGTLTIIR